MLVSGGGSGIGAAIVEAFCGQGARVAFLDIAEAPSLALAERLASATGGKPMFLRCDLRDESQIASALAQIVSALGGVDVLVNNAANDQRHKLEGLTLADWNDCFSTNLTHQFLLARAVLPDMRARGEGSIVNMTSTSFMVGQGGMPAYTAAKAAVIGLTRSIARDYGLFGIRCNAVAPGWIMTERQVRLWLNEQAERRLIEDQCLKAKLYPEDLAPVVLFLASRVSAAITGQTLIADAGKL